MEGGKPSSRRRKSRLVLEEETNREGHWTRSFSARSEPWPVIEHWATEAGFRLAAVKGKRRLYQRGADSPLYREFLDIKQSQEGLGMTVSAWLQVGFWARAVSLFRLPSEMNPEPHGFFGVRARRRLGRDLNVLLERFRQRPITGTGGFHPSDLDLSLLVLAPLMLAPALGFIIPAALKLEVKAGLSNPLLVSLGKEAGEIGLWALGLLTVQSIAARFLKQPLHKALSAAGCFVAYTVMCVFFFTWTATESLETRFAYHCLHHYNEASCKKTLDGLSSRERDLVLNRIHAVQKELSYGPAHMR